MNPEEIFLDKDQHKITLAYIYEMMYVNHDDTDD